MSMLYLVPAVALALITPTAPVAHVPAAPDATHERTICGLYADVAPWWEVYDDGLRAIDRGDWQGAIVSLTQVIRQNSRSSASARTYGMRFISYFPYYYLGVAHYNLGQVPEALAAFEKEQSSRAIRSSDRHAEQLEILLTATEAMRDARERQLAARRAPREVVTPNELPQNPVPEPLPSRDPSEAEELRRSVTPSDPPRIAIVSPSKEGEAVSEQTVRVHGVVVDKHGIAEVTLEVNGDASPRLQLGGEGESAGGFQAGAAPDSGAGDVPNLGPFMNFSSDVRLQSGVNRVVIRARNIYGVVTEEVREIEQKR
jgi:hypothetical protein